MTPRQPAAGLYLHWPFCERKCPYCDFHTFGREHTPVGAEPRYLAALLTEIDALPERLRTSAAPPVDSIYFGGGTPSLMSPRTAEVLFAALDRRLARTPDCEITLELNPTTLEVERLQALRVLGVNRVSVGCQSFDDRFLGTLGRVHDAATTRRALEAIRALGIADLSIDLIFGLPGQSIEDLGRDLDAALAYAPEHISVYGLTLHEGTPFARQYAAGALRPPDDDTQAAMFELLMERLAAKGYEHYEISNWSRPGRASRHNARYWRDADVIACGAAVHGRWRGRRYANPADLDAYQHDPTAAVWETPSHDPRTAIGEIMMLALRRVDGAAWDELSAWAGRDPRQVYARELDQLQQEGLIVTDARGVRLTRRGILFADDVALRFF